MNKIHLACLSFVLTILSPMTALSQEGMIGSPVWKPVPGTDLPSKMRPDPQPWRVGVNTIVRNGDVINFDVDADGEYVRYLANCKTGKMAKTLTGDFNTNGQVLGIRRFQGKFFLASDNLFLTRVLEYACSQK